MKSLVKFVCSLFLISILASSCEINVFFDKAMPPDVDALEEIPEQFQGVYMCESDSSIIYSSPDLIYKESYFRFVTTVDRIIETENCSIVEQGLYLPGRKECIPFEYISEDLITADIYEIDTLFSFDKYRVAKYYKGRLFLNIGSNKEKWITFMITPSTDGSLIWEYIDVPDNIKTIEEITTNYKAIPAKKDKIKYHLNPTLVEFDRILDDKYMQSCDVLTPVNYEL